MRLFYVRLLWGGLETFLKKYLFFLLDTFSSCTGAVAAASSLSASMSASGGGASLSLSGSTSAGVNSDLEGNSAYGNTYASSSGWGSGSGADISGFINTGSEAEGGATFYGDDDGAGTDEPPTEE